MSDASPRLCIHWSRFGPYHVARATAAHKRLTGNGIDFVGLETAGTDCTYEWRQEEDTAAFQRVTVFPDEVLEAIDPGSIFQKIYETLDRLNPDVVAVAGIGNFDARCALEWSISRRKRAIIMAESTSSDSPRNVMREQIKRWIVSSFRAALAGGTLQREYLIELGFPEERISLGYDVVDNDYFNTTSGQFRKNPDLAKDLPGIHERHPYFLASNRFVARKNLDELLRAYGMYTHEVDNPWPLVLLGDGEERPHLERIVEKEAISGVVFAGFRQIEEIPAYYAFAGAFIHPARVEQWGLVVNEAMAAGLPVLLSRTVGCLPDLLREGENGYSFDPDDRNLLANLMVRLSSDTRLRAAMGRRSLEIIQEWSPDRFAEGIWRAFTQANLPPLRLHPLAYPCLWTMRQATRSIKSFHAIET